MAYANWKSKYRYGEETPFETQIRKAKALSSVEEKDQKKWEDVFIKTLVKFDANNNPVGLKATMGGRITANIGTNFKGATLINCYVTGPVKSAKLNYTRVSEDGSISYPVEISTDPSPDDLVNIFLTIMEQAKTLASEGGYGMNFDWIRPRGSLIKGTGIEHPGVVAYMKVWDSVATCIVQGNSDGYVDRIKNHLNDDKIFKEGLKIIKEDTRKGAMMGCLSCWHPDIEEFIRAKDRSGDSKILSKFNVSVLIPDDFMRAVDKDEMYDLQFAGKVYKRVRAKDLYNLIMESTYNNNEPGVLFADNMMKNNPVAYLGAPKATNPCGEIPGLVDLTTVCLLGSLNLTQYVRIKPNSEYSNDVRKSTYFDFDLYSRDIKNFTRMLDNVNDLTYNALPSYNWSTKNLRQIGMGLNGLGSALMMLGIPYNSEEGIEFAKKVADIKENLTWQASSELAREKGCFPIYDKDKFTSTPYFKSDRLWDETKEMIIKYGVRNAKTTTNPPLGNSSIICDNVSNGIEPAFKLMYERKKIVSKWPEGLNQNNVKSILRRYVEDGCEYWRGEYNGKIYYYEAHNRGLCEVSTVRDYGYQWLLDNFPSSDYSNFAVSTDNLKIDDHLKIQKVIQYHNNQSVSKTCNVPNNYPFEDFSRLYFDVWKMGLNGFTTYREGTMESVLSDFSKARDNGIIEKDIKLPDTFLNGPTKIIKRENIKFYIHFSYLPEDVDQKFPIVIWIYTNDKEKKTSSACNFASRKLARLAIEKGIDRGIVEETLQKAKIDYPHNRLGRMISLNLRHNVQRVDILTALMGIEGDNISTLLTAVRKFLAESIEDGTSLKGKGVKCVSCGSDHVALQSGCINCLDCGNSACG